MDRLKLMTASEALTEAQKAFGPGTSVGTNPQRAADPYHVTVRRNNAIFKIAYAESWEKAIAVMREAMAKN